jgi:DNA polymerase (family 10)
MARAAADLGYQYLGVSDHTHNVAIANGMSPDRALLYADEVLSLRGRVPGLTLLAGVEVDILKDGSLDLPDAVLERFDYVIASVHSHFSMPEEEMTARVLRAMEHRFVSILAHPTGRLIGSRSSIPLDIDRVLRAAARTGTLLELNSNPERLDLDDVNCRKARTLGIPVAISSDAHERRGLDNLQHGVVQARRGWLEPRHVANTLPVEDLLRLLRRKR